MPAADYRILTDSTGQRIATALEGMSVDRAEKTDLTSIIATGTTNTTGAAIAAGAYFYLNGALVQAKTDISSGATFTSGTNYEAVTAGGLNSLNDRIAKFGKCISEGLSSSTSKSYNLSSFGIDTCLIAIGRQDSVNDCALFFRDYWGGILAIKQSSNFTVTGNQTTITVTNGASDRSASLLIVGL